MIARVPTVPTDMTIGQVHATLRRTIRSIDSLHYVYVVDDAHKFTGVLSIKDLYRHSGTKRVGEVCRRRDLLAVQPGWHQERAAYMALVHGIKAIPVTDHDHVFLGVITGDRLLKILYEETHEDLLRRAGIQHRHQLFDNVLTLPLWQSILHRVPWLLVGLGGGLLAAQIVQSFERTLTENVVLAAFIPLVVYMGGAVSTQMEAFIIRDLAIDHHLPFWRYLLRQFAVVASIGALCAVLLYGITYFVYGQQDVSFVLSLALFAAVVSAIVTGLVVPYAFARFRLDPANASGPLATIIQDIASLLVYFSVATLLLGAA